ncbi:hypothetical protein [Mucilaginibacter terrae]|uniref:ABC transporter permease n=1 Tax=Mucilaginibacter terrae TaxID=1955052 RepID=A0ABU3GYX5_9SPHI|nr:hypothetical protein [Mucilaginibacter terrae]MDT3404971.1 hypothetical protein [Mucilaginibacter terrae]
MNSPLTHILNRIFVCGFYQAHAGMFLFFFLVMIGAVDPGQLLSYHKTLMVAFITSPLMLLVVLAVWLLYTLKCWHYVVAQIGAPPQHFLFYSSTSYTKRQQLKSWFLVQAAILLPVIAYGLTAVGVGFYYGFYWQPAVIVLYLLLLTGLSAWLYTFVVNRLIDGSKQSWLLNLSSSWKKPYYSLYLYHIANRLKIPYLITKGLSWIIITAVFQLFADVQHDARVAGMAVLAIAVTHGVIVFEGQRFEHTYLSFARNFSYPLLQRYGYAVLTYCILLLPEGFWLFGRFNPLLAVQLFLMMLSMVILLHTLIYYIGLNMDRYLQWIMGLFIVLFWVMMFKLMIGLVLFNVVVSYLIFYRFYYRDMPVVDMKK